MPGNIKEKYFRYKALIDNKHAGINGKSYIYKDVQIPTHYVRTYHNAYNIMIGLTGCTRALIDYLVLHMSKNNIVYSNEISRREFNGFMNKFAETSYSDVLIKKSFSILKNKQLLIPFKRGSYIVNPFYFSHSAESLRVKMMRVMMEIPFRTHKEVKIDRSFVNDKDYDALIKEVDFYNAQLVKERIIPKEFL